MMASSNDEIIEIEPPSESLFFENPILRVPSRIRENKEIHFEPHVVSIGPFHRKNMKLQGMEKVKEKYLKGLLTRADTRGITMEHLERDIRCIEKECRKYYAVEIDLSEAEVVKMMVFDGSFILEFLRKVVECTLKKFEDPVFDTLWLPSRILIDLLLLENQIPWQVLECLFNLTSDERETTLVQLTCHSLPVFKICMPLIQPRKPEDSNFKHFLDYFRHCLLGSKAGSAEFQTYELLSIPSVSRLQQGGVDFHVRHMEMTAVTFAADNGVMEIPQVIINLNNESLFRNVIAYEQYNTAVPSIFISYVKLMQKLIISGHDVDFLREKGILRSTLSSDDVLAFFHSLYNETAFDIGIYASVYNATNNYCKADWKRWQAILTKDYFSNPWKSLGVITAVLVLGFGFLQTIYTILSYYHGSGS